MRFFLTLFLLLIPLTLSCILEPHTETKEIGPCYAGLQEYESLLKSRPPVIEILEGFPDTIFLDSIISHHQVQFSFSLDSSYLECGSYGVSIDPEMFSTKDSVDSNNIHYYYSPYLEVASSPLIKDEKTRSFTSTLTFTDDSTSYYFWMDPRPDTTICKLRFQLDRSVDNNFCSSTEIRTVKAVVVRRRY